MLDLTLTEHASLEECRQAGIEWMKEHLESDFALECRLNCRTTSTNATVCERTEPVTGQ
jgi:hypothetical protein